MGILCLELLGDFASCLVPQNLFSCTESVLTRAYMCIEGLFSAFGGRCHTFNPSIIVHAAQPTLKNRNGEIQIPFYNRKQMEALIPQETSGKERSRRHV